MTSSAAPTWWWSAAARSAPGPPSCWPKAACGNVVLLEATTLGDGASSRAAGMVRAQGGTETAIRLGLRTQEFYAASGDRFPLDCGFAAQGYLMPCFTDAEVQQAHERIALQRSLGLDVEWLSSDDSTPDTPAWPRASPWAPRTPPATATSTHPATCWPTPRRFPPSASTSASTARSPGCAPRAAESSASTPRTGPIDTDRVVLTGGPQARRRGHDARADAIPAGGTRHQVVVTAALPGLDVYELPMVFDVTSGIYWRPGESGGLLWGMSNPDEPPGVAVDFDSRTTARPAIGSRNSSPP